MNIPTEREIISIKSNIEFFADITGVDIKSLTTTSTKFNFSKSMPESFSFYCQLFAASITDINCIRLLSFKFVIRIQSLTI